ncbi:glycosyl hydrolase [Arthrobacter sp. MYb229]|uniref:sialidase family protein n=1 Tax=unclassified Arthrobacter TaxID=235627 RepID=UPI000CFD61B8|nr:MULTISPECIES: exo-alpha-sialidase [unclassified Arthrobacter]PRA04415.1 glycosyl hydrolase [Arthrobacter sp. MYb229]PRB51671.1 glycosyl hydrolase [Arthrobacter sp. MYb216]
MPLKEFSNISTDGIVRHEQDLNFAYLPAPTVQSHAANLMTLGNGRLGCVWFGGTQEGVADISIYFSYLDKTASGAWESQWSEPRKLSNDATRSEQNPILFVHVEELWLLYTAQHAGNQDTSEVRRRISCDNGETWSEPETLFAATAHGGVFVRQPPVVVGERILVPIFRCATVPGQKWVGDEDDSALMVSSDGGKTWVEQLIEGSLGCVHMNIAALADGSLMALYRSRWADAIYFSKSEDQGVSWTAPVATELPNNNSSIQFTAMHDGRLALIYNHSRANAETERRLSLYDEIDDEGLDEQVDGPVAFEPEPAEGEGVTKPKAFWGTPRAPLTVAISEDGGQSWTVRRDLEVGDGYCLSNNSREGLNREFSYPSIHQSQDGLLHLAYTYFRQAIKYVRVDPSWIYQDAFETNTEPADA